MEEIRLIRSNIHKEYSKFIYWYLGNKCNYRCSYCHPDYYDGQHYWHPPDIVSSFINQFKKPKVFFSGGEPTFHPQLFDIFEKIDSEADVGIVTNASRSLDWYEKLVSIRSQTIVVFSYHYRYADENKFYEKAISLTNNKNCTLSVTFLLPSDNHYDKSVEFYYKLKEAGIAVQPKLRFHVIENRRTDIGLRLDPGYTASHYDWASKENENVNEGITLYNKNLIPIKNVSTQYLVTEKITNFEGWTCYAQKQNMLINPNGDILTSLCAQQKKLGNIFSTYSLENLSAETCRIKECTGYIDMTATKFKKLSN